jgi:DNA-binding NarL/FixJ family response regulator
MLARIFVVDDHPIMRRGYGALLSREHDMEVCGEAGSAEEAIEHLPELKPDIAIVDISMEGMNGIELIKRLTSLVPDMPILVVSMHDEMLYAERALRAGARGYIMKKEVDATVVKAIRRILHGGFYLSDRMSNQMMMQYQGGAQEASKSPIERLSDRELEVFELLGRGLSTRDIAEALHISPKTVETHRGRIKNKLALNNSTELLQRAVQWTQEVGLQ